MNEVYKVKETATGAAKLLVKDDTLIPEGYGVEQRFGKLQKQIEVLLRRRYDFRYR